MEEAVAQTSEEDLQSLRKSIDATPEAASALKAKDLSSSHVVAINIADGVLTIFAKKVAIRYSKARIREPAGPNAPLPGAPTCKA